MTLYLMEIESIPPPEYERFTLRRMFWQEMGLHYDAMPHIEVQEALLFRALEAKHPHRFQKKAD